MTVSVEYNEMKIFEYMFNTIPVLQSAGKDIGRFYTGLDETPDYFLINNI